MNKTLFTSNSDMRRFILEALIFVSVISAITFLLCEIELPNDFIVYKTEGTSYEKIVWNLDLLENEPERISKSVIFLGPSLVQGGVEDSVLTAQGIPAINMGVNHNGNEIELWFLQKLLPHSPKAVYLHLSKETHVLLHPMTPLLYTPSLLLLSGQSLNIPFCNFLIKRISYVVEYFFWSSTTKNKVKMVKLAYGIRHEEGSLSSEVISGIGESEIERLSESAVLPLNDFRFQSEKDARGLSFSAKRIIRWLKYKAKNVNFLFNAGSQQRFVEESFSLCKRKGVPIAELYLPVVVDTKINRKFNQQFFAPRATGKIAALNSYTFLNKAEYWFDMNHLSRKGAILFTQELIKEDALVDLKEY